MKTMVIFTRIALGAAIALALVAVPSVPANAGVTEDLQAAVAGLSAEQQASLFLLLKQLQGGSGGGAAASPEAAAAAAVEGFFKSGSDEDIDAMMSYISDDFDHYEYGDKEGIKDFLDQAIQMGYLDGIELSMEDAEFEIDGDEIIIYPVDVAGAFGAVTFEFIIVDGLVIGFDAAGL